MRIDVTIAFVAVLALVSTTACGPASPAAGGNAVEPAAPVRATTPLPITGTIRDVMDAEIDPSADFLWESVATIITKTSTIERRPRTDEDWAKVRRAAVTLGEAAHLIVQDGRRVGRPGDKSENPGIELEPDEVQRLIDADRATFLTWAASLQAAAGQALAAIERRDADGLMNVGDAIDQACENCHLKYWYPGEAHGRNAARPAATR